MDVDRLSRDELLWEVTARGIKTDPDITVGDLRKKLRHLLRLGQTGANLSRTLTNDECDNEFGTCETKIQEIQEMFRTEANVGTLKKIATKIWHISNRLNLITADEHQNRRLQLLEQILRLQEELDLLVIRPDLPRQSTLQEEEQIDEPTQATSTPPEPIRPDPNVEQNIDIADRPNDFSARLRALNLDLTPAVRSYKAIPVYKWGIKFTGDDRNSLETFLEDVEDRRRDNSITTTDLLHSASGLFGGSALQVYRYARDKLRTWDELVQTLRKSFRDPDYDHLLKIEINKRKQGPTEPFSVYVAKMFSLYKRMERPPAYSEQMQTIELNCLPDYQEQISVNEPRTIDELENLVSRLERGRLRARRQSCPPNQLLEPDLSKVSNMTGTQNDNIRVIQKSRTSPVYEVNTANNKPAFRYKCWNCRKQGHAYRNCPNPPNHQFCNTCGMNGTTTTNCPRCRQTQGNDRQAR